MSAVLRRKHTLVVDVTFSKAISEAEAVMGFARIARLLYAGTPRPPVWAADPVLYLDRISRPKRMSRVRSRIVHDTLGNLWDTPGKWKGLK